MDSGFSSYHLYALYNRGQKKRFLFLLYNVESVDGLRRWGMKGGEFMVGRVKMKGKDERFIGSNHRSIMTI